MKRRFKKKRQQRRWPVKRRGWLAGLLSVGFWLFGLAFGLMEYFIAAAVFALLLLIAALQAAGQRPRLNLEFNTGRVVRGEVNSMLLKAYNPRFWPFFPLRLALSLQKEGQESTKLASFEIALKPKAEKILEIEVLCPHRGEYTVFLHQYYAEDVFGFFALPNPILPAQKLLSLPQMDLTPPEEWLNRLYENEDTKKKRQNQQGQLIAESRLYQQGDALRTIHWKKSASRRELMSRLREPTADSDCCLLVDNRPPGEGEQALFCEDRLCEAALSFLFTQLVGKRPIKLLPGGLNLSSAQSMAKAAEYLATMPFAAAAVVGELESLLENRSLPPELYIVTAQSPTPLLPWIKRITDQGCQVVLLAPAVDAELVLSGLAMPLPVVSIHPPIGGSV